MIQTPRPPKKFNRRWSADANVEGSENFHYLCADK